MYSATQEPVLFAQNNTIHISCYNVLLGNEWQTIKYHIYKKNRLLFINLHYN